jgi:hypothetical protein
VWRAAGPSERMTKARSRLGGARSLVEADCGVRRRPAARAEAVCRDAQKAARAGAMATLMRRTLFAHLRADLSSLSRMVPQVALANWVPEPDPAQRLEQDVGKGGQPQQQLVGAHRSAPWRSRGGTSAASSLALRSPLRQMSCPSPPQPPGRCCGSRARAGSTRTALRCGHVHPGHPCQRRPDGPGGAHPCRQLRRRLCRRAPMPG